MTDAMQAPRVEKPLVPQGQPKEVIYIGDESTSMTWEAAEGSKVSRWALVTEAMPLFVSALEDQDSEAKRRAVRRSG